MAQPAAIVMPTIRPQLALNRMGEKRGDRAWLDGLRTSPEARYVLLADLKLAVVSNAERTQTRLRTLRGANEVLDCGVALRDALFLGLAEDGAPWFAAPLVSSQGAAGTQAAERYAPFVDLRSLALQAAMPVEELAIAGQARSLVVWHGMHRCCGRCGARTRISEGGWRRDCWACGQMHFPRSDPAVIMAITHGGRLLLGHEHRFPEKLYSVLAGFVEPGDDVETAVRRETMEEAGIPVGAVTYMGSQPWPFPHSLMIACWGEALSDAISLSDSELPEARWVDRTEVAAMLEGRHPLGHMVPPPLSVARTLIRAFADGAIG
jgi:NAD+ diphosphatase